MTPTSVDFLFFESGKGLLVACVIVTVLCSCRRNNQHVFFQDQLNLNIC